MQADAVARYQKQGLLGVFQAGRDQQRVAAGGADNLGFAASEAVGLADFHRQGRALRPGIGVIRLFMGQNDATLAADQIVQQISLGRWIGAFGDQSGAQQHAVQIGFHHQVAAEGAHQQAGFHGVATNAAFFLGHGQAQPAHVSEVLPHLGVDAVRRVQAVCTLEKVVLVLEKLLHARLDHLLQLGQGQ
ncbi:hypothetical protein D9M69_398790 [compost metagenome]